MQADDPAAGMAPTPGQHLRDQRLRRDWTLQALARRSGVSVGMLSQIERGLSAPSARTLQRLSEVFALPVEAVAGDVDRDPDWIRRRAQRRVLEQPGQGVTRDMLLPEGPGQAEGGLQLMLVTIAPGGASSPVATSDTGQAAGTVLDGVLQLEIDGVSALLGAGDGFRIAATRPYRFANPGPLRCRVLWAVTPPQS